MDSSHLSWLELTTKTDQVYQVVTPLHGAALKDLTSQSLDCFWWMSVKDAKSKQPSYKYGSGKKVVKINRSKAVGGDCLHCTVQEYLLRQDLLVLRPR